MTLRLGDHAPTSRQKPRAAASAFTTGSARAGACCSRIHGLHAGLHDRAGPARAAASAVRATRRQAHRPVHRHGRVARAMARGHSRNPGQHRALPDHCRRGSVDRAALRHAASESRPSATVRTVFVIDPARKVRLTITYPQTCGRNFDEILRVVDSLQPTIARGLDSRELARRRRRGHPALDHRPDARRRFPQGWYALRPYLRLTPDPRG